MSRDQSPPRGASKNSPKIKRAKNEPSQIEYLLHQSTQGVHLVFSNRDIAKVMMSPQAMQEFRTTENMEKVQSLLSGFLSHETFGQKKDYLEGLTEPDFSLLIRAYFQLVENTILAHSSLRH